MQERLGRDTLRDLLSGYEQHLITAEHPLFTAIMPLKLKLLLFRLQDAPPVKNMNNASARKLKLDRCCLADFLQFAAAIKPQPQYIQAVSATHTRQTLRKKA